MKREKERKAVGRLMTEGPAVRQIAAFTLPLLFGNVFQQLYNMEKMENSIYTAIAFGVASGLALTAVGIAVTPAILRWMKTPDSVLEGSVVFLRIYFAGSLPSMLYNIGSSIIQALGESRKPLYYLIAASLTNIVLDLVFVAVFGWGIAGAAFATVLAQLMSAALVYRSLAGKKSVHRIDLKRVRFHREELKLIVRLGVPSGLQNSIVSFSNVIVQSNINSFGDIAMAGCGAYGKIEGFALMPSGSFTLALTTFVSQNIGAGKHERAKKGAWTGLVLSMATVQLTGVLIYLFAPVLTGLFSSDPEVVRYGTLMARSVSWGYFMLAFSHGMGGVLRGAGLSKVSMAVMIAFWCGLRVAWILAAVRLVHDIRVVFFAYPLTWACSFVFFMWYFFRKDWLYNRVI